MNQVGRAGINIIHGKCQVTITTTLIHSYRMA